ncbi:flagellar motor protein MotB [Acidaminobacter sp.]|uniref:flagellar motor protein MotB n=1 Tax=Acidaminobacter sp. TaxID=1872102 RepID=UPI00137F88AB|nr:flagellar motor protein MotB [Acidaminobacter sp.]MDK9710576.1 OmpA family protein [Acidaminobacter sp.]MZQ96813.1 OmpA family protein [Acidaminobacter sp.]
MARRRKKNFDEASSGSQGWIVTFSDLMTLLLTFFILLYSFSTLDIIKFKQAAASLQSVLSGNPSTMIFNETPSGADQLPFDPMVQMQVPQSKDQTTLDSEIVEMFEMIQAFIKENGLSADLEVTYNAKGVLVNISEAVLFESGKAEIKTDGQMLLDTISKLLTTIDNDIEIQGHTDNQPIQTDKYPTNWELSVDRAVQVTRYFVQRHQIEPDRLKAAGFAEFQPLVPNSTYENRALNRRVNLLIIIDHETGGSNGRTT